MQLLVAIYLLGLAVAQPAAGILCDRFGRRPVMLAGFALFAVASLMCATAQSLEWLLAARLLQAIGVSVGTVVSRALLRDSYDSDRLAESMSYISVAMGVAPITAPVIGGFIDTAAGFTWIFWASAMIGGFVTLAMLNNLRETLPSNAPKPRARKWLASYRHLLCDRKFLGYTLSLGFVQGSFFSFIAVGATLFTDLFDMSSGMFGALWGLITISYVAGSALSARLTPRIGATRVLLIGSLACPIAGALIASVAMAWPTTPSTILLPIGFLMLCAGAVIPGSMAAALSAHPGIAGTASGLSSALGLVVGGGFSIVAGILYNGLYLPIALLMLVATILAALSWMFATTQSSTQASTPASQ